MRLKRVLGIWAMLALLMFFNGALREVALEPIFGRDAGDMMSAFLGLIIVFGASRPFLVEEAPMGAGQILRVSLIWFALTVAFETGLGITSGQTWPQMLRAYAPWKDGSLWPIILVAVIAAPFVWLPRKQEPQQHVAR
jgi:hypothetical protein